MRPGRVLALLATAAFAAAAPAAADEFRLLRLDGFALKWGEPAFGTPAEVTWGFATSERRFPDAINCAALAPFDELAPVWGREPARLAAVIDEALGMWSRSAAIVFRPAAAGEEPDILIGAQAEPDHVAFANVWHGKGHGGIAPLVRATICLNPEQAWSAGPGPAPQGMLDLATVLAHEVGHAIGLDHPGASGALMAYSNQGALDALMPGDVAGARALYGVRD